MLYNMDQLYNNSKLIVVATMRTIHNTEPRREKQDFA